MAGKRFAAIVAGMDKEYQCEYITGLATTIKQSGDDLFVFSCQGFSEMFKVINERAESRIFHLLKLPEYNGIASLVQTIPDWDMAKHMSDEIEKLTETPVVTLDVKEGMSSRINFNDDSSMTAIVEHMMQVHHCKTFALIEGPVENTVARRRTYITQEMIEKNHGTVVMKYDGRWTRAGGRAGALKVLELEKLPDAILCCNDDAAMALIDCLREHNVRVPQDVLVTGVDARRDAIARGITTVRRPVRHAGVLSAEYLLKGKREKSFELLENEFVVGTTCGCPKNTHRFMPVTDSTNRDHSDKKLLHAVSFNSRMAAVETLEQAADIIIDFARACDAEKFYLAVDPMFFREADKKKEQEMLPEKMLLLAGVNKNREFRMQMFMRDDLIPGLAEDHEPKVLTFMPLYYGDRSIGYMAADLEFAMGPAMLPVTTLINGALMELAQRATIKIYVDTLEKLTHHDPLTGLYNRRGFYSRAEELFGKAMEDGKEIAILSIDMDSMKLINDRYGHLYGDEAIRRMGRCVLKLNQYEVLCSHMSGDEFMAAAIVPAEGPLDLPRMLEDEINRMNREEPWITSIHASVGMFISTPTESDTLADFIRFADNRMYENKRAHKASLRSTVVK